MLNFYRNDNISTRISWTPQKHPVLANDLRYMHSTRRHKQSIAAPLAIQGSVNASINFVFRINIYFLKIPKPL
jgi:hypothetical protein